MTNLLLGYRESAPEPGRLASSLLEGVSDLDLVEDLTGQNPEGVSSVVYARKSAQSMSAAIDFCQRNGMPLINLSTGFSPELPPHLDFLCLECPNVSLAVLDFMERVHQACAEMDVPFHLDITEHHQRAKKDRSGTAQKMHDRASEFDLCQNPQGDYCQHIISVRDVSETRKNFDIPPEHEQGFAIHEATLVAEGEEEILRSFDPLVILGRRTYAEGLAWVLETLSRIEPITGKVSITDFRAQYR